MTRSEILDLISVKHKFDATIPEYLFKLNDSTAKINPMLEFQHSGKTFYLCRINSTIIHKHNSDTVICEHIPTSSNDYAAELSRAEVFAFFEQCPQEIVDSAKEL